MGITAYKSLQRLKDCVKFTAFSILILLTQTACPDNPDPLECVENQIEVNGTCECVDGYHWNEDNTKCLMDTTSHYFVWEIDMLGDYGSYLKDVAIIDENNVWVVGNIESDSGSFNAALWDGSEWELVNAGSKFPKYSIFTLDFNDIWIASTLPFHYDGNYWRKFTPEEDGYPPGLGYINAIWGTSSFDIYFVGDEGNIVHYDGSVFTKMESGTDYPLHHIYGTAPDKIWATGDDEHWQSSHTSLLFYDGMSWEVIYEENYPEPPPVHPPFFVGDIRGVSSYEDSLFVITNVGLWRESVSTGVATMDERALGEMGYPNDIAANHSNDVFVVGDWGLITHYNGKSWRSYSVAQDEGVSVLYSIAVKDNHVFIAGTSGANRPICIRGIRQ